MEKQVVYDQKWILNNVNYTIEDIKHCDNIFLKYFSWSYLSNEDMNNLQLLGKIDILDKNKHNQEFPTKDNYWSKEYPIALRYYPNNGCEIYRHKECSSLYLIYVDFGGHAPERRCRLLQRELIIFD